MAAARSRVQPEQQQIEARRFLQDRAAGWSLRITSTVGDTEMVARLDGDEFAILLEAISTKAEVEHLAASLIEKLDQPR